MASDVVTAPVLSWPLPAAFIHSLNKYLLSTYHDVPGHISQR